MDYNISQLATKQTYNNICISHASHEFTPHPLHTHDFYELVFILNGTVTQQINDATYVATAGDVFVLKHADVHGFIESYDLEVFNVGFKHDLLFQYYEFLKDLPGFFSLFYIQPFYRESQLFKGHLHLNATDLLKVKAILYELEEEFNQPMPGNTLVITSHLQYLITFISRKYFYSDALTPSTSVHLTTMTQVAHYIEKHFTDDLSNTILSELADMSINSFINHFKATFQVTPINYILALRIRKACELLQTSSLTITEISHLTGFSDSNYFSRVFKQLTGFSPTTYKKQLIK